MDEYHGGGGLCYKEQKSPKFKATHVQKKWTNAMGVDPKDPWAKSGPLCKKNGGPAGRRPNYTI